MMSEWKYGTDPSQQELEKCLDHVEKKMMEYGAEPTEIRCKNPLVANRITYEYNGGFYRADYIPFDVKPCIVLEYAEKKEDVINNIMEDCDPFDYDASDDEIEKEIRIAFEIKEDSRPILLGGDCSSSNTSTFFSPEQTRNISRNISNLLTTLSKAIEPTVQKTINASTILADVANRLANAIGKIEIQFPEELFDSFQKFYGNYRYLQILEKIKWPLFLEQDEELTQSIINTYEKSDDDIVLDAIASLVCDYFDDERIDNIYDSWCRLIANKQIKELLEEGIELHKQGKYYGSTTLFMSQVDGLISAGVQSLLEEGTPVNEASVNAAIQYYELDEKNFRNKVMKNERGYERGKIVLLILATDNGALCWNAMAKYIRGVILMAKDNPDMELMQHQPLRNKIFHGDQINFGTQEHSLKSLLTVDLLIQLNTSLCLASDVED